MDTLSVVNVLVLDGGTFTPTNPLCCPHYPLQCLEFEGDAVPGGFLNHAACRSLDSTESGHLPQLCFTCLVIKPITGVPLSNFTTRLELHVAT